MSFGELRMPHFIRTCTFCGGLSSVANLSKCFAVVRCILLFTSSKAPSDPMLFSHLRFETIWFAGIDVALCM